MALGYARMRTYLLEVDFHAKRALHLYRWNQSLSAAFWPLISLTEVALRNAMDRQLGSWCEENGGPRAWLLSPEELPEPIKTEFAGLLKTFIEKANDARNLRDSGMGLRRSPHPREGNPLTNDDVLAQITLGQWSHFVPGTSGFPDPTTYARRVELWQIVAPAFPSVSDSADLYFPMRRAQLFRNRVAHHEPIFDMDLQRQRNDLLAILGQTSHSLREWYLGSNPLPATLAADPRD